MSEPLVCAVMLTKDRPEMARRAVAAFEAQTYANKRLIVFDTSSRVFRYRGHYQHCEIGLPKRTIGHLRNRANDLAEKDSIIIHFDDDDYSHPDRISEQVELLKSSGADCVGYNEVLFWRSPIMGAACDCACHTDPSSLWAAPSCTRCDGTRIVCRDIGQGEAWIYRSPRMSPAIGSSLCYWRSTWERRPFADAPKAKGATSEYYEWLRHCKVVAVPSLRGDPPPNLLTRLMAGEDFSPRLICSIHGGNTQCYAIEALIAQGSLEWTRAPGLDAYARKVMAL